MTQIVPEGKGREGKGREKKGKERNGTERNGREGKRREEKINVSIKQHLQYVAHPISIK